MWSRGRTVLAIGVLLWAGWAAFTVLPEWMGWRGDEVATDFRVRERARMEAAYSAGWLTRYVAEHGELPARLPRNPAAARNRLVVERCEGARNKLTHCSADWGFCPADGKVRALACTPDRLSEDGGWQTPSLIPEPPAGWDQNPREAPRAPGPGPADASPGGNGGRVEVRAME